MIQAQGSKVTDKQEVSLRLVPLLKSKVIDDTLVAQKT
jgi:hypothetical protein